RDLKQGAGGERVQRANGSDRGSNPSPPAFCDERT
ncbi:MAG: hypothetical protein ACI8XM_000761, partial [Haloarculaceae archaeon]